VPAGHAGDINLYRAPGSDLLHLFGSIAAQSPARHFQLAMSDPARTAGMQFLRALQRHGIRVDGQLRVHAWPQPEWVGRADAGVLAQVQSPPLSALLREGLKRSQNLYLQNLLQLAGTRERAAAATDATAPTGFASAADWGLHALHRLLGRIGIEPTASQLDEGTGLSRRDLTTPAALVRLLVFLAAGPDAAQWRDMLPVAGVDGTLAGRMRGTPAAGNVHAKTGSMSQVSGLAGYVTSAAGEHLAFAILLNGYQPPPGQPASADVDAIAVRLAELSQKTP
jgi:D-alanyl-D-alanine carboxypeptidase/D-alanyl-D-alanine-endopeptidase (penicillin-binding protein 4)